MAAKEVAMAIFVLAPVVEEVENGVDGVRQGSSLDGGKW